MTVELLGYKIDTKIVDEELPKIFPYTLKEKNMIDEEFFSRLAEKKNLVYDRRNIQYNPEVQFFHTYAYKEIMKEPENIKKFDDPTIFETSGRFYRKGLVNPNSDMYFDMEKYYPTPKEIIDLIKKANGLVFIPHIYDYGEYSEGIFDTFINNCEIDGMECYHPRFSKEQTEYLLDYCKKNNLYKSGGSDYHGTTAKMGSLNVPADLILDWV